MGESIEKKEYSYNKEYWIVAKSKSRAKSKNLEHNIEEIDIVIPEYCPVLGIKIDKNNNKSCNNSPSIDRINPNFGYIKGNIRIISHRANMLKNNATVEEMELILKDLKKINKNSGINKISKFLCYIKSVVNNFKERSI